MKNKEIMLNTAIEEIDININTDDNQKIVTIAIKKYHHTKNNEDEGQPRDLISTARDENNHTKNNMKMNSKEIISTAMEKDDHTKTNDNKGKGSHLNGN